MPDEEIQVETPEEESAEVELKEAGLDGGGEIVDPGQNEGKRPSAGEVPETVERRVSKAVAQLRGAEETIEKLKAQTSANEAVMSEVRKHNAALMEKLETLSNKAIDAVETSRQPAGDPPEIVAIQKSIAELEARKEDAVDNLKGKEVVQIDKELRKLERVMEGYEFHKRQQAHQKKEPPRKQQEEWDPDKDPDVIAFKKDADWYEKNPIMTGAAKEYDLHLSALPEWRGKPLSERFKEVKRVVEEQFSVKRESKPKPPGAESGIGLQRPGTSGARTVKLSAQQLQVAEGLGIKPEDYAKQLAFLGGAV